MAKNEALAVLHATLDFRRVIDVPGYERIPLDPSTRYIGTMNYGYAGTWELNEALVSRFVVVDMPVISSENLEKLIRKGFPTLSESWLKQFAALFQDLRKKCDSGEISTKALDLRGLLAALHLIEKGLRSGPALELGIVNKVFDPFERQLAAEYSMGTDSQRRRSGPALWRLTWTAGRWSQPPRQQPDLEWGGRLRAASSVPGLRKRRSGGALFQYGDRPSLSDL